MWRLAWCRNTSINFAESDLALNAVSRDRFLFRRHPMARCRNALNGPVQCPAVFLSGTLFLGPGKPRARYWHPCTVDPFLSEEGMVPVAPLQVVSLSTT